MRFNASGPNIPDALLEARDLGDVLFFCGAGVSRQRAGLPDFARLAWQVAFDLGAARQGPARRLLDASKPKKKGRVPLPFAVDRVFSLLQQEFEVDDVRRAVAQALRVPDDVDLSPHRTLLALSRTRNEPVRLVTTNFDLLFERTQPELRASSPPHLPDPRRKRDFYGIMHLHGVVTDDHDAAQNDEFVLSSAEFGHAYLSDGWATRFIQALVQRYIIVFVGYSADDPPVQYLLEAMNRASPGRDRLYAFHEGTTEQADEQWSHRGVTPIPFQGFDALWTTLDAWAQRARDVEAWQRSVVDLGMQGPQACAPHERGMVAHLAKTIDGARFLIANEPPLPAEWLFVFDRAMRYSRPLGFVDDSGGTDPFDALSLDDDPTPEQVQAQNPFYRRSVPSEAWDAFEITAADRRALTVGACAHLTGQGSVTAGSLPTRVGYLAGWFTKIAHQPAAVAWLAGKGGFHERIRQRVEWRLRQEPLLFSRSVREGWSRLLVAQPSVNDWHQGPGPDFAKAEWTPRIVRTAVDQYRPRVVVERGREAPWFEPRADAPLSALLQAEVDYPRPHVPINVPVEYLPYALRLLVGRLELAIQLEEELKGPSALYFDTVRGEGDGHPDEGAYKLTGLIATVANWTHQLGAYDPAAAQSEVASWSARGDRVFGRLRIWAAGHTDLMAAEAAAPYLLTLPPDVFWYSGDERDLLCSLRDRWSDFSPVQQREFEERLLEGTIPWFEGYADRAERAGRFRLGRIDWLRKEGIRFSDDGAKRVDALRAFVPGWDESDTNHVAQPRVRKARWVGRDESEDVLAGVPLADVVATAEQLAGYDFDRGVERNPFAGLVRHQPQRALRALVLAARKGQFAPEAWSSLLYAQTQADALPDASLLRRTARRLAALPETALDAIAYPVSDWMLRLGHELERSAPNVEAELWNALIGIIRHTPQEAASTAHDWVDQAINRPAGKLTDWLFTAPVLQGLAKGAGVPAAWAGRLETLLLLPEPHRFHALAVASRNFVYLNYIDSPWAARWLLPWSADTANGGEAFWAGFVSAGRTPPPALFARMKAQLLSRAIHGPSTRRHPRILAGMLLAGWRGNARKASTGRAVSNAELREALVLGDDELRRQTLLQLGQWAKDHPGDWQSSVIPFLQSVWPLQRVIRSVASTSALIRLAFDVPETLFDRVVDAIVPRLTRADGSVMLGLFLDEALERFVEAHADALVRLFWAILTEEALDWPYGASSIVVALEKALEAEGNAQLSELVRRHHLAGGN